MLFEILYLLLSALLVIFSWINKSLAPVVFLLYTLVTVLAVLYSRYTFAQQKRNETEINKTRIVSLMNTINSFVVIWTEDGSMFLMNEKLKGVLKPSVLNSTGTDILSELFPHGFGSHGKSEMMLSSVREFSLDSRFGTMFVSWSSSVLFKGTDETDRMMISIGFDVTENKIIRQQLNITNNLLATSEKHYSLAMNLSEIGIILNEHCDEVFHISK